MAKRTTRRGGGFRPSWQGQVRFGLVAFTVKAINAQHQATGNVHFHLLHAPDHKRIHYSKVCPQHGEVSGDEIVEGYEYAKGKYVEFSKEELDELRSEQEKALTVDAFIGSDEVDPIFFDGRMYYLVPAGKNDEEPYALLQTAMSREDRWAIGQVVFSGREQLAVVRAVDGMLVMSMLNYSAEMREPTDLKQLVGSVRVTPRKLKLATDLVKHWQSKQFDLADYKDRYQKRLKQAIEAKLHGNELPAVEEEEPEVINLMDALQQSVAAKVAHRRRPLRIRKPPRRTKAARRRRA